jgi:hypothetical protein
MISESGGLEFGHIRSQDRTYPTPRLNISDLSGPFTHETFTSYFLTLISYTHSCLVFLLEGNGSW